MNIYIVYLVTGEYADREEYIHSVFKTKTAAEKRAKTLRKRLDAMGRHINGNNDNSMNYSMGTLDGLNIDLTGAAIVVGGPYKVEDT